MHPIFCHISPLPVFNHHHPFPTTTALFQPPPPFFHCGRATTTKMGPNDIRGIQTCPTQPSTHTSTQPQLNPNSIPIWSSSWGSCLNTLFCHAISTSTHTSTSPQYISKFHLHGLSSAGKHLAHSNSNSLLQKTW